MKRLIKAVAAIMLMNAVLIIAGCKPENDPNNGGGNGTNGNHEYVDLGLPSGTLWATCNVGASTPEGYGDYYAWGETQPKSSYNWTNYKYCNGSSDQLTKYCSESEYGMGGFTDNLTVLQDVDDAATVNWGSEWQIPTAAQWDELKKHTTSLWTVQNDVNGRRYTGNNGKSIFIPAGGIYSENLNLVGTVGYYWTNELLDSRKADVVTFKANGYSVDLYGTENRESGRSVRPVRKATR